MRAPTNVPLLLSPHPDIRDIRSTQLPWTSATRVPGVRFHLRAAAGGAAQRGRVTRVLLALFIALAGSLGGCASPFHWIKDGFSAQHAEARFAACQLEAERLRYVASESDEERETRTRHEAGLCMKADGWRWAQTDGESASDSASSAASENPASTSGGPSADSDGTQSPRAAAQRPAAPDTEPASQGSDEKTAAKPNESSSSDTGGAEEEEDDEEDDDEE